MLVGELGVRGGLAGEVEDDLAGCFAECGRASRVRWVGPERGAYHRPARRQRSPRPPDVERGDVPMPDRLLPPRMGGDALDGQVNFDEALGVVHRGKS